MSRLCEMQFASYRNCASPSIHHLNLHILLPILEPFKAEPVCLSGYSSNSELTLTRPVCLCYNSRLHLTSNQQMFRDHLTEYFHYESTVYNAARRWQETVLAYEPRIYTRCLRKTSILYKASSASVWATTLVTREGQRSICNRRNSFNGHFPGQARQSGTRMSPFWILLKLRMTEVVVTTGAVIRT